MVPELNSTPASPRAFRASSTSASSPISRRTSQTPATSMLPSAALSVMSQEDVPLPMRHPRPMTAAELHLELEQEQEAVVNRLTRELSALRAQTASAASNASSTSSSASVFDHPLTEPTSASSQSMQGSNHPTPSRRHRSSSSLSVQSTAPGTTTSQASLDRARDAVGASSSRSRGNSLVPPTMTSIGMPAPPRSRAPSASPSPAAHQPAPTTYFPAASPVGVGVPSPTRYEEAAAARAALEFARKENEMLAARVRELEGLLKAQTAQEEKQRPSISVTGEVGGGGDEMEQKVAADGATE